MTVTRSGPSIRKVAGTVGAEISGVSLERLGDDDFRIIHKAFLDHGVLVFRDQFLKPAEHVAFARRFGDVMVYKGFEKTYRPDLPEGMFHFSNDGKEKVITERWHFDGTYYDAPPAIGILAPDHLPEYGGDTMWSNQYVAYERLSDSLKNLLCQLRVRCESHRSTRKYGLGEVMSATHPAVRRHPETKRLSLYIGDPETCNCFVGMTPQESAPLINYLYEQACQPDNTYRHNWRLGDIVMWDNRCTMHFAVHDYGDQRRDMYRMTINGQPNRGPVDETGLAASCSAAAELQSA